MPDYTQPGYYGQRPIETTVKNYFSFIGHADKKFAQDAARMAQEGWRVVAQSQTGEGILVKNMTVTYQRP